MAWYFLSRILAAGLTLVTVIVLTRVLTPAEYGSYNMVILAGTTSFALLLGWGPAVITRFHSASDFDGRATGQAYGIGLLALVGLAPFAVGAALLVPEAYRSAVIFGAVFCAANALNEFGLAGLRVYGRGPAYAAGVMLRPVVGVGLVILFVALGGGFISAVIGMAIGAFVTGAYATAITVVRSGLRLPTAWGLRTFLAFGVPVAVISSSSMIMVLLTQSLLAHRVDLEAVGIYAAAQSLAQRSITMPMITLTRASAASIFEAFETDGGNAANDVLDRHFSFLMLIAAPLVAVLVFSNHTVAAVLFNESFQSGVAVHLPYLAVAAFLAGVQGSYFAYAFLISRRTSVQFLIMLASLVGHAGLATLGIALFGPIGASLAILGSSILSLLAYVLIGRSMRRQSIPLRELRIVSVAVLAMAPLLVFADSLHNLFTASAVAALGVAVFVGVLYLQGQQATSIIVRRMRRFRSRARS